MAHKSVCANCFEEVPWTPVRKGGDTFCCDGCAAGGPCICTYDGPAPRAASRELTPRGASPGPKGQSPAECSNCFEELDRPAVYRGGLPYCCWGCAAGGPCTCTYGDGNGTEALVEHPAGSAVGPGDIERAAAPSLPPATRGKGREDLETLQLLVWPLAGLPDIKRFTRTLEKTGSISHVALLHFDSDRAAYELKTDSANQVVKDLMDIRDFPIRSLRMAARGFELVLHPPSGTVAVPSAQRGMARRPALQPAPAKPGRAGEPGPHSLKFQMGIDVFFNGRHQVGTEGEEARAHMHSWRVQAILEAEGVDENGEGLGGDEVRQIIYSFVTPFNNKLLNKVPPFDKVAPTPRNIARVIYEHLDARLAGRSASLKAIRLWESPTSYVEYVGDGSRAA